jgi:hypothetical protein
MQPVGIKLRPWVAWCFGGWPVGPGVITVICIERAQPRSRQKRVVVSLFGQWQKLHPIILLVAAVLSEIGLEHLVDAFGLTVGLRVKSGRHSLLDA